VLANAKTCHKSGGTRRSMSVKGKRRHTQDSSKLKVSCGIYIQQLLFFFSLLSHLFLFFLLFRVPPIYALSIEALLQLSRSLSERCVHAYEACTPPKSIYLLNDVGNITRAECREYFSQFSGTYT
jgi:hypothetical protein